jgi:ankyrin repeat protein
MRQKLVLLLALASQPVWAMPVIAQDIFTVAREGDLQAVEEMLGQDPSLVHQKGQNGSTPLHLAALQEDVAVLTVLIEAGAKVNAGNDYGYLPLHYAVMAGQYENVALLIEAGTDIDATAAWGNTALHLAASRHRLAEAELLITSGADVNATGSSEAPPLHGAVRADDAEMVTRLLDNGADVEGRDAWGTTPLHVAAFANLRGMLSLLVARGANVRAIDQAGTTPLHRAAAAGNGEVADSLVAGGADVNARDGEGRTPLHFAARYGHRTLAEWLKRNGASDASAKEDFGLYRFEDLRLDPGEALIWYLGHSGWAVKTKQHFLIFDYSVDREPPADPKLANGFINTEEIKDQDVLVFVSHEHTDHFDRRILEWQNEVGKISYVFAWPALDDPRHVYLGPRAGQTLEGVEIEAVHSEEAGAIEGNFLVRVDGLTLYHSGDYSRGHAAFKTDMDHLAAIAGDVDLFFMLAGNAMDNEEALIALESVKPRYMFPMHQGGRERAYRLFAEQARSAGITTGMVCAENRGDHFHYRDGRIERLHE